HRFNIPRLRAVRVVAELPLGAALAQQVPALVELLADVLDALLVFAELRRIGAQALFLVDQVVDVLEDRLVLHGSLRAWPTTMVGRAQPPYRVRARWVVA